MAAFQGWDIALLHSIGAPVTAGNLKALRAWQLAEGGSASNNPLNTTQPAPGASSYNSVGVRNFTSPNQGVRATAQTLLNGHYGDIVSLLRSGKASPTQIATAVSQSPWGTGSGVLRVLGVKPTNLGLSGTQPKVTSSTLGNPAAGLTQDAVRSMTSAALLEQAMSLAKGGVPSDVSTNSLLSLAIARRQATAAQQTYGPQPTSGSLTEPQHSGNLFSPTSGKVIGAPYQGTHARDFNAKGGSDNWESENAVDVSVPVGTPVRATTSGVIGNQFGSLGEGGRFAGLRLHLVGSGNEYYYAHLSKFAPGIQPGAHVKAGQIIGYSGEANGVAHLHFAQASGNPLQLFS